MVLEMENTNEEDIEDETNILHIVDDNNQLVRYKKVLIPFRFKKNLQFYLISIPHSS